MLNHFFATNNFKKYLIWSLEYLKRYRWENSGTTEEKVPLGEFRNHRGKGTARRIQEPQRKR